MTGGQDDRRPDEGMSDPVRDERSGALGLLLDSARRRRFGHRMLSVLTAVLFVAGAGMFSYPFFTDLYTGQVVQSRLAVDFEEQLGGFEVATFEDWEALIEPGRALTKIVIPDLGVETLVVHGTTPDALRAGAGHCHPKGSAAERLIVRAQLVRSHPPGTYGPTA